METEKPGIGPAAILLGYAGLLPQGFAAVVIALGEPAGIAIALVYGAAILSFLGGVWWGLAMRLPGRQAAITGLSVGPSLVASAILLVALATESYRWPLVALGVAILFTLPVDRWLEDKRVTPPDWMRLRVPLSMGLAALTFLVAVLAPAPLTVY